ncbi:hypothetical protein [Variovorax sp. DXTD-1]|uniref:hypothetical protein n=1 Tax=Variovorax sp. DXTD-1 TaxID=2495592 RepID=UPI000F886C57|nr:hypothetical protein [Variovorax sp. DXTD-1]RST54049.1 hypothetical protein EJI00_02685 [Variovorax sp. DXTD-1]
MHEEARLKSPFPAAARFVDDLISISLVEKHFKTSHDANNALTFVCADCGVPVSAVIIEPFKVGRKITPSSSFRRRDPNHPHTCNREPAPDDSTRVSAGEGKIPANPNRDMWPTRWVDPRVTAAPSAPGGAGPNPQVGGQSGTGSRNRNGSGSGTSESQSQTVEKFARGWHSMNLASRKTQSLAASWNSGGTFFSAFHPLDYDPNVPRGHMKIFVGTAREVVAYPDGFDVMLHERQMGGPELCVWIPTTPCLAQGAAGAALQKQLLGYANTPVWTRPVQVHVLGTFDRHVGLPDPVLGLELGHPHMIWISSVQ